jgi:hypothetical protein
MKTKDKQIDKFAERYAHDERRRYPHPGCFCKRACKLLKTNEASGKKSAKSPQECESTGVARKSESESRSKRLRQCAGEDRAGEKINRDRWRIHYGWRLVRGSLFFGVRLEVASRFAPQERLCHGLRYAKGYARTTGRRDNLGAGSQGNHMVRTTQVGISRFLFEIYVYRTAVATDSFRASLGRRNVQESSACLASE